MPVTKTKWGDREQRRKDILQAAREEVAKRGYLGFSMREVAAGAGVSAGTLYSYFVTKEQIFATLYAERLVVFGEQIDVLAKEAIDLEAFLFDVAQAYMPVYAEYGHHFDLWVLTQGPGDGEAFTPEFEVLRSAAGEILLAIGDTLRRLGAFDGFSDAETALILPLLWSVMTGMSDHFTGGRHLQHPYSFDDVARFAARMMVTALKNANQPA